MTMSGTHGSHAVQRFNERLGELIKQFDPKDIVEIIGAVGPLEKSKDNNNNNNNNHHGPTPL
jgi:hypothetical protein